MGKNHQHQKVYQKISWDCPFNLDPDSNQDPNPESDPDPESGPELITDPDPNLQIISDPSGSGSGCTTLDFKQIGKYIHITETNSGPFFTGFGSILFPEV